MVLDTLEIVKSSLFLKVFLVDKEAGQTAREFFRDRHIKLTIILNDVTQNGRKEGICLWLPLDMSVGQAGFKDGQFVFSEPYFLKLRVQNGFAVSGNPNKFVIERK